MIAQSSSRRGPRPGRASDQLTRRERQILVALSRGASYDDVAVVSRITINTVRTHVRSIYGKLGATTKTQAVITGLERGLLSLGRK